MRARYRAPARESEGDPSYYVVRRRRVGPGLLSFTRRMVDSGALSSTKAAKVLGVKFKRADVDGWVRDGGASSSSDELVDQETKDG